MTAIEQLEISRLDSAGQVIRRIRCLAGRVTVFRANSAELLESYHKAFEGVRQSERFSMVLDSATFKPHEHHLIGFGERFGDSRQESVAEYLEKHGVESEKIEQLLLDHGLGGLSGAPCADLSTSQERIVRILAATASTDKVMILNDPFEIIPEQWREKLALLIVNYAWKKRAIVVVTKLTYRPQEWIENEIIARIQLERPRQRTIGFGGEGFNATELVQAVRAQFAGTAATEGETPKAAAPLPPPVEARPPPVPRSTAPKVDLLRVPSSMGRGEKLVSQALAFGKIEPVQARSFGWGLAVALSLSVIMITGLLAYGQLELYSRPEPISKAVVDPEDVKIAARNGKNPDNAQPPKSSALERYPSYIRDAVLQAFTDPSTQVALSAASVSAHVPPKVIEQSNFSYPASEDTYAPPENFAAPQIDEQEMERRREEIRQRFLEAIQAQSNQGQ